MKLPHSYFWNLAKSPVMVYDNRLYLLKKSDKTVINPARNFIEIEDQLYEFTESETLSDLELLYKQDFSKEIDEYKTNFLNRKLKKNVSAHIKWKLRSMKKSKKLANINDALLLILEKIIPEIEGKNPLEHIEEYSSKIDEVKISKIRIKLGEFEKNILNQKLKQIQIREALLSESLEVISNKKGNHSTLGNYVLHNFNMVILPPDKFFVFSKTKSDNITNISGSTFYLKKCKEFKSLNALEDLYLNTMNHIFKCEALDECDKRIKELEDVYRQEYLLKKLIKDEKFHGEKGGFYRHSSGKFVFYLKFPQFVNKFNGSYYLFPEGKIAIGATYNDIRKDFSVLTDSNSVLSAYYHPFTDPYDDSDESHLCIGEYKFPKAGKGYEKIPQILAELKTLLMCGYNDYHRKKGNVYNHSYRSIGLAEANRKGIPVTNQNVVVSEGTRRKYENSSI